MRGIDVFVYDRAMRRSLISVAAALGAVAALSGCTKGEQVVLPGDRPSATAGVASVSDATACAEFATAYRKFVAGTLPANGTGDRWSELADALDAIYSGETQMEDLSIDISLVLTDAKIIDLEAPQSTDPKDLGSFDSDVAQVGRDCGKTFTPMGEV